MRLIVVVTMMAMVAGCATQAQRELVRLMNSMESGKAATEACQAKVTGTSEYRLLAPYLREGAPSLAAQANPAKATPEEIKAVFAVQAAASECRKIRLEALATINPALVTPTADAATKVDTAYLGIVERRMTWGEFVRDLQAARDGLLNQYMAIAAEMERGLMASHEAEVAQYKEAAKAILSWSLQQYAIYQQQKLLGGISRPRTTNCQYVGKRLICTTF